jgi:hypothetical protein
MMSTRLVVLAVAVLVAGCGGAPERAREDGRRVTLYTHCGVVSATVEGELWLADPPLGEHNAPSGWDQNSETGAWRKLTADRAEFRTDSGKVAAFVRAQPGTEDPSAGCE